MNISDDKITDGTSVEYCGDEMSDKPSADASDDKPVTIAMGDRKPDGGDGSSSVKASSGSDGFVGEAVALSVKAVAVALSVFMLILSILTVVMPLSAMRVFNKLGMSERAINSGERYINNRTDKYDAGGIDERGNFKALSATPQLTNSDFIEALDVCISLSYKLTEKYAKTDDVDSTRYFAQILEKYTRMYMSLSGFRGVSEKKNAANIAAVPMLSMRPYVCDYDYDMMRLNFRARVYMGATDLALYDSGYDGDCVQTLENRSNSYAGIVNKPESVIDGFVDYVGQLGEYLSIEFERMGVDGIVSEAEAQKYRDKIDGAHFRLFIDPTQGFTRVYNNLKNFGEFAQAAVDYVPKTLDDRLRQLHWLAVLSSVSSKMWYMAMLTYYNDGMYGVASAAVRDEYTARTCEMYHFVNIVEEDGKLFADNINDKYNSLLTEYINLIRA